MAIITNEDKVVVREESQPIKIVISEQGAPGPPGIGENVFVGPTPPDTEPGQAFLWIQTGLGEDGQGFTFWFDG